MLWVWGVSCACQETKRNPLVRNRTRLATHTINHVIQAIDTMTKLGGAWNIADTTSPDQTDTTLMIVEMSIAMLEPSSA